jgi:Predicted pPIWI-associating nuclease
MARSTKHDGVDPDLLRRLREFQTRVRQIPAGSRNLDAVVPARGPLSGSQAGTMARLRRLSPRIADSFEQALRDVNDGTRLTYGAPAGEAREVLRQAIDAMAPDDQVRRQSWFKGYVKDGNVEATQAERVQYAAQLRGGDYRAANEATEIIDQRIGRLGRMVYKSGSAALHAETQQTEVRKMMGYVFAVLDDVLPE